jgi:hypothetical protein
LRRAIPKEHLLDVNQSFVRRVLLEQVTCKTGYEEKGTAGRITK